jgi:hypothetical protein
LPRTRQAHGASWQYDDHSRQSASAAHASGTTAFDDTGKGAAAASAVSRGVSFGGVVTLHAMMLTETMPMILKAAPRCRFDGP